MSEKIKEILPLGRRRAGDEGGARVRGRVDNKNRRQEKTESNQGHGRAAAFPTSIIFE